MTLRLKKNHNIKLTAPYISVVKTTAMTWYKVSGSEYPYESFSSVFWELEPSTTTDGKDHNPSFTD